MNIVSERVSGYIAKNVPLMSLILDMSVPTMWQSYLVPVTMSAANSSRRRMWVVNFIFKMDIVIFSYQHPRFTPCLAG